MRASAISRNREGQGSVVRNREPRDWTAVSPHSNAELRNRLSRTAKAAVDARGLALDRSAQDAIDELVSRAAERLEGTPNPDIARAENAFDRLATTLVVERARTGGAEERGAERVSRPIDDSHVQAALVKLCPGFWPFC